MRDLETNHNDSEKQESACSGTEVRPARPSRLVFCLDLVFAAAFFAMLLVPLYKTNRDPEAVSLTENRKLAAAPVFYRPAAADTPAAETTSQKNAAAVNTAVGSAAEGQTEAAGSAENQGVLAEITAAYHQAKNDLGRINPDFTAELGAYLGDRIGFREKITYYYAGLQYYLFGTLPRGGAFLIGPDRVLNYADSAILKDYQHFDLRSEESMESIRESYQKLSDYMASRGIQYYYMQCWDKQSIYPEYFPTSVLQYGAQSKTDLVMEKFAAETSIHLINLKPVLLAAKDKYEVYSRWGDATHWTERGAFIGYQTLMQAINAQNQNQFKVMTDADFDIEIKDRGAYLYGGIHEPNMSECFSRKVANAVETKDKLTIYSNPNLDTYYTNANAGNDKRVLILGDSYIYMFMLPYFAESFHDTIMFAGGDYRTSLATILDTYKPDIVINENAERVDRFDSIVETVRNLPV